LANGSCVEILTDSLLVVSQLRGEYRIRDAKLSILAAEVKTIAALIFASAAMRASCSPRHE
jgi:ribonuclease HI